MNLDDYVAVALDAKTGTVVHKDYAAANGLTVLTNEPTFAHGRLRGTFRLDGRRTKPKATLPKAIPTPQTTDKSVSGKPDSSAVENIKES
jgi:hypothetical protein